MGSQSSKASSSSSRTKEELNNSTTDSEANPENTEQKVPFKSKLLEVSQKVSSIGSAASQSQIRHTRQYIKEKWGRQKITKIQKWESPLEISYWKFFSASRHILKHWEIIATINECLHWRISFGQDGQENEVDFDESVLISRRKDNKKFEEYIPEREILVEEILNIIEQVKDKEYNIGEWNCQIFTDHIVKKMKSP